MSEDRFDFDKAAENTPEFQNAMDNMEASGLFNFTETGLAERLARDHGQTMRWCETWKKWLVYDTTRWDVDASQQVRYLAKSVVQHLYGEAEREDDATIRKALGKFAIQSESKKARDAMVDLAKSEPGIAINQGRFNTDGWLLNVMNGTVDLRTGTLRPHAQQDYITKLIPIDYDADASCPQWEDFLGDIMGKNEDLTDFLWKAIGYSLTGDTSEQCLFFLWGGGSNGKSTFLNILRLLLGDYSAQTAFTTFLHQEKENGRDDVADLVGVRLAIASEVEEGKRLSSAMVRTLTGQDSVKARRLYENLFEYVPQMKIWLAMNHKPVIKDTSNAIWRRVRLIPFTQKFEGTNCDAAMPEKLQVELPGILAWAVRGCTAWQQERLAIPEAIKGATSAYRAEMDVLGEFLNECCEIDPRADVLVSSLYDRYVEWCQKSGEAKNEIRTKRSFGLLLQERGFEPARGSGGVRLWKGLRLIFTDI